MKQTPRRIHFIGICGTAMASVAAALKDQGYDISGSDANVYPPMSTFLEGKGIRLRSGYGPGNLDVQPDVVVVGNAISRGNPELEEVLDRKMHYVSLPELMKEVVLRGKRNFVVTGTHGKTTTTSMLAWLLDQGKLEPGYMIGGIPVDFGQGACFRPSSFTVLEGDEYDTAFFDKRSKFLHYLPEVVLINNIEFDHADIYENLDAIKLSFRRLVRIVPRNGLIIANADDPNVRDVVAESPAPVAWVGVSSKAEAQIVDLRQKNGRSSFALATAAGRLSLKLGLVGEFNARNAAMAVTAARRAGVSDEIIVRAMADFQGVKRRQEVRGVAGGVTIVDDFGHHPTAIRETLTALREKYSGARLWAFFEPRSNTTRRAVFQTELPSALALADGVFVSQVARLDQLPPENRLDPEKVMRDIRAGGRQAFYLATPDEMVEQAAGVLRSGDVAVVFSNGGFGGIHEKLMKKLQSSDFNLRTGTP
ncbi:MAG: UDP-N-acetylmuramate:L-alanyl-gamma-D-glutamyl-meso-diaminopimelate ligase [Verrucomicrobiae bacterium]|nr:UDP-N-acetylmuramate:L-alanyl-gamma-D-glutamyl-meso-diaminopimelate ligase [Verrucomicrobiae bacterium]